MIIMNLFRLSLRLFSFRKPGREVYLTNLPKDATELELKDIVKAPFQVQMKKGFCFLLFENEVKASEAIDQLHLMEYKGSTLRARFATPRAQKPRNSN